MRVLMFGWEYPPHISGGLGTACQGLTQALARLGEEIVFVVPRMSGQESAGPVRLVSAADAVTPAVRLEGPASTAAAIHPTARRHRTRLAIEAVASALRPYMRDAEYRSRLRAWIERGSERGPASAAGMPPDEEPADLAGGYGRDLMSEVHRYALAGLRIAERQPFDVIHAHDWMAAPAGIYAKAATGRPLVFHVHSTEYDRSGENVDQAICRVEQAGIASADHVVAVSHYTRQTLIARYGADPGRVSVVHNAVSRRTAGRLFRVTKRPGQKIVLFLGRVTFQKGPDYFIEAAGLVAPVVPDARFVMAGTGDMLPRIVRRAAELRIGSRVSFTGFLAGADVERMYAMSDLYVMPSVSEPFGISPLEAILYDVPVILSRQAGVNEVLHHALKVDFWDVRELANKIIGVLLYPTLAREMIRSCRRELRSLRWDHSAEAVSRLYRNLSDEGRN